MRLDEFKAKHKAKDGHFFDADTMRFFRSRILDFCEETGYFLTSEKKCFGDPTRVYSIRQGDFETGTVKTVVYGHVTIYKARKEFLKLCLHGGIKFKLVKKGLYRSECGHYEVVRSVLVIQVWTCRNIETNQIEATGHTIAEIRKKLANNPKGF